MGEPSSGLHAPTRISGDNYPLRAHPAINEAQAKEVQTKRQESGNIGARKITQEGQIMDRANGLSLRRL